MRANEGAAAAQRAGCARLAEIADRAPPSERNDPDGAAIGKQCGIEAVITAVRMHAGDAEVVRLLAMKPLA